MTTFSFSQGLFTRQSQRAASGALSVSPKVTSAHVVLAPETRLLRQNSTPSAEEIAPRPVFVRATSTPLPDAKAPDSVARYTLHACKS